MPVALWAMTSVLWVSSALLIQQPEAPSASLDFEYFQARVQPIFLARKAGFTRCVVCHSEGQSAFLEPLEPGAETWTEDQSRRNFDRVSQLVTPGQPMNSRLLLHPLEPEAGGDEFHNGGRQFASQDDPDFRTIAAWVLGETADSSDR